MNNRYHPLSKHHLLKTEIQHMDTHLPKELNRRELKYYNEIFRRAYEDAYYRGYDAGYSDGYDDGYEDVRYNELNAIIGRQKNVRWHGKKSKSWYWL